MPSITIPSPSKWLADHNVSSHTISAALTAFALLYTTDNTLKTAVNSLFSVSHPQYIVYLTWICGVILNYKGSHSTQGQLALIAATPPEQVAAASAATHITPPKVA